MMDSSSPIDDAATLHSMVRNRPTEHAEHALVARISVGDRSALERLYFLYFDRLAKFYRHLTAGAHPVEEMINDAMFSVWQEGAAIAANASVSIAIMGLAYSLGAKRLAAAGAPRAHAHTSSQYASHAGPLSKTSSIAQAFLLKLPVKERAVLHLVYAGAHSRRDIADIMNISGECVDALLGNVRRGYAQGCVNLARRPLSTVFQSIDDNGSTDLL